MARQKAPIGGVLPGALLAVLIGALAAVALACSSGGDATDGPPLTPTPAAQTPTASAPRPVLLALHPPVTTAGAAFNVQPDGQSALAADTLNAASGVAVVFNGEPLATVFGSDRLLTAVVPAELYSTPGRYPVYLVQDGVQSNTIEFLVEPAATVTP
jgi:hypothetical protein